MGLEKIITKVLQRYWRSTRALTMGAQGVVIDPTQRVLLVRHTYRPGWHFPGGGVEKNETVETALSRELEEEVGIFVEEPLELFGLYANFHYFPSDHVALFLVRNWRQPDPPAANREIAEHRFFGLDALPDNLHRATHTRLSEIFDGKPRSDLW